jgi:segregation and condensation protein A
VAVSYEVTTPVFEGPFDLLLHLILSHQVDMYEVSLTAIVDAYLAELSNMERFNLDVTTEFLLIAATLVELKARSLLPADEGVDLDDELALFEERDLLLSRLLDAKTFKDAARVLEALGARAALSAPRRSGPEERFWGLAPDLLEGVSPLELRRAYLTALAPKPKPTVDLSHVASIRFTVTDVVRSLTEELPSAGCVRFRQLTASLVDRVEVVVHFLAILELFKQGRVELLQARTFGDIDITWVESDAHVDLASVDSYDG